MAEAIISGVLSQGVAAPEDVSVGEVVEGRCRALRDRYGVSATTVNAEAAGPADLVVLSVKPQDLPGVLAGFHGNIRQEQAVMSIVAGAKMSTIADGLGHRAVIRVMPNTPAQIGEGMSLWACSPQVSEGARDAARSMLGTVGKEVYVSDEKYLDMATALSASGPAYVFLFIEALIDAGVHVGLPRDMSRTLAVQTVLGSTRLLEETGRHPAALKDMVTSPGGTTVQGLLALERGGLRAAVVQAVDAAYRRSMELGKQ